MDIKANYMITVSKDISKRIIDSDLTWSENGRTLLGSLNISDDGN